jgi:hypothetical protein
MPSPRTEAVAVSRRSGRELALAFARGAQPQPVPVPLTLRGGEICVGSSAGVVLQWLEGQGEYVKKSGGYMFGGGGLGLAFNTLRLTSNLVGNSARRTRAGREATLQWRPVDQAQVYVTNSRFALHGSSQWVDIWYEDIRMSDCDGSVIQLEIAGLPRTALQIAYPDYWFVMFHKLAYDRVLIPPANPSEGYFQWTPGMPEFTP